MTTSTGTIFDLRRYSIHDGPGIRTAVFFKGCALRCVWCHNPESQAFNPELLLRAGRCILCESCAAACPQNGIERRNGGMHTDRERCTVCGACVEACYAEGRQIAGHEVMVDEIMETIRRDRPFYERSGGGVTLSGGEPLGQPEFLLELLQACKAEGLHTALDTCGHAPWEIFEQARPLVDLFLYDLKLVDDARHIELTDVSNALILDNLRKLAAHGGRIILRIPVIPGINDDADNLQAAAELAAKLPPGTLERLDLLPYHSSAAAKYTALGRPYPLEGVVTPSPEQMTTIAGRFSGLDVPVTTGG
jgi:pyruvate formate lyase activating enzyme